MRCYLATLALIICLAALAGSAPLSPPAGTGQQPTDVKFSESAEAAAAERQKQIEFELATLPAHPWAGSYFFGDGLGVNVRLSPAPKSGFVFAWNGCLGLYDRNYGDVVEKDGKLQLHFTHPNDRHGFRGIAPEFLLLLWGDRHYLIPADGIISFANQINSGREPVNGRYMGSFLLREDDAEKNVRGQPCIPPQYLRYLLATPVRAQIIAAKETRDEKCFRTKIVLLNVGAQQRLLQGMKLHVYRPRDVFETVEVTNVLDSTAEGKIVEYKSGFKSLWPAIGWKLSTKLE